MTELDKNTQFFSRLVARENLVAQAALAERLQEARAHERTVRRATGAVAVLGLVSVSGIGYAILFEPQLSQTAPTVFKLFYITGLASVICLVGFVFFWFNSRSTRQNLIDECRDSILATLDQPQASLAPFASSNKSE